MRHVYAFQVIFEGVHRDKAIKHMISKQALQEYKEIWRKENPGKDIDDQTAMDEAVALLILMDTVYRPVKKEWLDKYKKENPANSVEQGGVK
jgi:hypothetical protein